MNEAILSEYIFEWLMLKTNHDPIMIRRYCSNCGIIYYQYPNAEPKMFCTIRCQEEYDIRRYDSVFNQHVNFNRDSRWAIEQTILDYEGELTEED